MLYYLLRNHVPQPLLGNLLHYGVYYLLIFVGILVGLAGVYRRLQSIGYDRKRVATLIVVSLLLIFPAALVGAWGVGMFYYPARVWSVKFFWEQFLYGHYITYHGGLIIPFFVVSAMIMILRMRFWDVLDTFFLYIPVGYIFGRTACLLVGCCWGNRVHCAIGTAQFEFENPVPLYAIAVSLLIFFVLRKSYDLIYYVRKDTAFRGLVSAFYLILYGNTRLLFEVIRTEQVILWGMTQAQIVMLVLIAVGFGIALSIAVRPGLRKS